MKIIEITSLPKLDFAHIFQADHYNTSFPETKNTMEITYISQGSLQFESKDDSYIANKGDIMIGLRERQATSSAKDFHCHHTVGFSVEWNYSDDFSSGLILPCHTQANSNLTRIYNIIDTFIHNPILYKTNAAKTSALFFELVCEIDSINKKINKDQIPGHIRYAQLAKEYVQKNIYSPITQNAVAKHLGISSGYLCSIFKKAEGISLMKYINKIKLENMKLLMDAKNIRLYEVAEMHGYSDPNYASRLYKQIFGYNITDSARKIERY